MTRPSYRECLDAGMSTTATAKARGVVVQGVSAWAKRNGVKFQRDYSANAERGAEHMRKMHADPDRNPLVLLSPEERAAYDNLKRARYSRPDAFRAIGRADLAAGD